MAATQNMEREPNLESEYVDRSSMKRYLRQGSSIDLANVVPLDVNNESRVLVLYTGGTIGMVRNAEGALAPAPHAMEAKIRLTCTMHDEEYSFQRFGHLNKLKEDAMLPLVLPHVPEHRRVIYTIYEYDPLLDSSNMTMDDWIQIAKDIQDAYELFDGFVILHGTDTLAYTASALSFMLENLGKPVIVTGSQIPSFETRSDGRDNFVGALILAGNYNIPEVSVYFRHQLMRGNRTVKVSADNLDAFQSPNMKALVVMGINIEVDFKAIHRPTAIEKFHAHTKLNPNVVLLRLFPSIRTETVAHFLAPPIEGVVLQCYGAGNLPNNRQDIMQLLQKAFDRGVMIITVTQCNHGSVSGIYETGKALLDIGIVPGSDITPEAALTKLSYVLSKTELTIGEKRKLMETNLVGEMTVIKFKSGPDAGHDLKHAMSSESLTSITDDFDELDLVQAVAKQLHIQTSKEIQGLREVLFPSIVCAMVHAGAPTSKLDVLRTKYGADLTMANYDGRTPLHVAASEGKLAAVEYLMRQGAGVHVKDRNNNTPLMCAIDGEQNDTIRALRACGAHLQLGPLELAEKLCAYARLGNRKKLKCFKLAGANLNSANLSGQTPLHSAVETGQIKVVSYLYLEERVDPHKMDVYGHKPIDIARLLRRQEIVDLLSTCDTNE